MCGVVALINLKGEAADEQALRRMQQAIVHRGPDDEGREIDGAVGLGFRRLSILDLSPLGHQPMASADGRLTIVFNGEIYNFIELRRELQALGHHFRSSGDTEVLLAAYRQWGPGCLPRLNGMWAFLIHDRERNLVFGARDRFGIKPLFRCQTPQQVLFASEIKAIRASGLYDGGLNLRTCAAFLYENRLDETAETFHEGIVQVAAGHAFELRLDGGYREWPFFSLDDAADEPPADPAGAFAELFEDAMRVHMRSDVPVGVNLSGGLDSTSIICAAARLRAAAGADTPLLAFCYMDPKFDENRYIDDTLAQTGARLIKLQMTPEQLWDSLPAVLAQQDEPVHSMTALVGYHLMALAARHGVKVILNGQGADELIGGYGSYFHDRWAELVRGGAWRSAWREISAYGAAHGGSSGARFAATLRRVAQQALAGHGGYRRASSARRLGRARARGWLKPDLSEHLDLQHAAHDGDPSVRTALSTSIARSPLPLYLRVEDRNSMAHSIEVRLPFLDHRLVSLVMAMDSSWKLRGPWNKFVLREAMRGRIPESVRSRVDKMGFPTDAGGWFRGALYPRLAEVLHDPSLARSGFFDTRALTADLQAHREDRGWHAGRLFAAAQFHLWMQQSPA